MKKRKELENEKAQLQSQLKNTKLVPLNVTLEQLETIKNRACSFGIMFKEGDDEVRRDLLQSLLWNLEMKDGKILSQQYKKPFAYFENLNKTDDIEIWRNVVNNVREIIQNYPGYIYIPDLQPQLATLSAE